MELKYLMHSNIKVIKDAFLKVILHLKLGEMLALITRISENISSFYFQF